MLCRTSTIRHTESGVSMTTPLLILSFSSKGFARSKKDGKSEIGNILATAGEFLTEVFLISAYDIFYEHLPHPSDLSCTPEMIFVDSGGYEISTDCGYSSVIDPPSRPESWTTANLESVYDDWPDLVPAVFVSFDHPDDRKPFADQVADARKLFRCREHLTLLLLKPETKTQKTLEETIKSAVANVAELESFDIVGVTEKELGQTMIDRMSQITMLRLAMNEGGVKTPLHIFGALDPLSVCLYYIAGAEIFDGLTWLRYGYHDGLCIYTHNLKVVKYGLYMPDDLVRSRTLTENYYALQSLQHRLLEFETTHNFDKLKPHAKLLSDACDSLKTKFKGRF